MTIGKKTQQTTGITQEGKGGITQQPAGSSQCQVVRERLQVGRHFAIRCLPRGQTHPQLSLGKLAVVAMRLRDSDGDLADVTANTSLTRPFGVRKGLRSVFKGKGLVITIGNKIRPHSFEKLLEISTISAKPAPCQCALSSYQHQTFLP